jgi:ATP-dependent helicase/nuclease subunit A
LIESSGAVTLMTIHASKGLEFPVVWIVDASRGDHPMDSPLVLYDKRFQLTCKLRNDDNQWVKPYNYRQAEYLAGLREAAEHKRLLYVAATRAQDYLFTSGSATERDGELVVNGWLGWLWHLFKDSTDAQVRLKVLTELPSEDVFSMGRPRAESAWDALDAGRSIAEQIEEPVLLRPVPIEPDALARYLSATHIADVGGAVHADVEEASLYCERFRRQIFHDAPSQIRPAIKTREPRVPGRLIGEIVHLALRYWRFPFITDDQELGKMLDSYAWTLGIVDNRDRKKAVHDAYNLLSDLVEDKVYHWITDSKNAGLAVYYELPFVFKTEKRIVHGIIDTLFQRTDGTWIIVDYKTSAVAGYHRGTNDTARLEDHARRYHLQLGVYASAVREQLGGITPETHLHYIRYSQTIMISAADWQRAVDDMESLIGKVVLDD